MSTSTPAPEVPDGNDRPSDGERGGVPGRRPTIWVLAGLVAALGGVLWLVLSPIGEPGSPMTGGPVVPHSPGPTVAQEAPAAPGATAPSAPPVIPAAPRGESGFAARLGPAIGSAPVDPDSVGIARQVCTALQGGASRATVENAVIQTGRYDQKTADALISAAIENFCPDSTPAVAAVIKDGTWQAGVDVEPGEYTTTAGDGCAWQRSNSPDADSLAGIIDSGIGAGPMSVTLQAGQYLVTSRCGEWAKAR